MTILEAIQRSAEFLAKKGVGSARLQAELLLAHVLNMPRLQLYLNFQRELAPPEAEALRTLAVRRGQREPWQYIVGSVSFCGLELMVNRSVLIPRPETEQLAERAWRFLAARAVAGGSRPQALDLGTGSGCLAIALAVHAPEAALLAVDISAASLEVARANVARRQLDERVRLVEADGFAGLSSQDQFDLIVSNPPYIPSAEIESLEPEVRDFEPRGALDGGPDGADFYRRIAAEAGAHLKPDGRLMVELEEDGAGAARRIFVERGWEVEAIETDLSGKPRILIARRAARDAG